MGLKQERGRVDTILLPRSPRQGKYRLEADEARHLSQVCRLAVDDESSCSMGDGQATKAKIVEVARNWSS